MKKLLAILLTLALCLTFAACGSSEKESAEDKNSDKINDVISDMEDVADNSSVEAPEEKSAVAEYFEKNGSDEFIAGLVSGFAESSGMTCTTEFEVVGNGFVVDLYINELENVPEETKQLLQQTYDSMSENFEASLETMQITIPELEYYTVNVCDKNGDVLAEVTVGK